MIKIKELKDPSNFDMFEVVSLDCLNRMVKQMIDTCQLNKIDPNTVPVLVRDEVSRDTYLLYGVGIGMSRPSSVTLQFFGTNTDKIDYFEEK